MEKEKDMLRKEGFKKRNVEKEEDMLRKEGFKKRNVEKEKDMLRKGRGTRKLRRANCGKIEG